MSIHKHLENPHYKDDGNLSTVHTGVANNAGTVSQHIPLIYSFFFKRGEQDIQQARTALESILHQVLSNNDIRKNTAALIEVVGILNPLFGETEEAKSDFLESLPSLCRAIRQVSRIIPAPVFLMIDALDECQDRSEQRLPQLLLEMVRLQPDDAQSCNLKIAFSARDSVDIKQELKPENIDATTAASGPSTDTRLLKEISVLEITASKNWSDLDNHLKHEVLGVLRRRFDQSEGEVFLQFMKSEVSRIVEIIHDKARGDFTLARMIIANLQQPSKRSLEQKVQRLPAAIGDIYMASIDSLSPDEQELVVMALKWVVWGVAAVTVFEVSDHYREVYLSSRKENSKEESGDGTTTNTENLNSVSFYSDEIRKIIRENPDKDPEVKDVIYHLENAGRDFFKLDRDTWLLNVDISVREWIQDNPSSEFLDSGSRGFTRYRDDDGTTIFKFRLSLCALNNESFQEKYMPWDKATAWKYRGTDSNPIEPRRRYEIDHWQDHLRVLQKWWTQDSLEDNWWSELLSQLSNFLKPDNWYRWSLNSGRYGPHAVIDRPIEGLQIFEDPFHWACENGLHILIDILVVPSKFQTIARSPEAHSQQIRSARMKAMIHFTAKYEPPIAGSRSRSRFREIAPFMDAANPRNMPIHVSCREVLDFLSVGIKLKLSSNGKFKWISLLTAIERPLRSVWLAYLGLELFRYDQSLKKSTPDGRDDDIDLSLFDLPDFLGPFETDDLPGIKADVESAMSSHQSNLDSLVEEVETLVTNHPGFYWSLLSHRIVRELPDQTGAAWGVDGKIYDRPDIFGALPLFLAARYPDTVKRLIQLGADINKRSPTDGVGGLYRCPGDPPIVAILHNAAESEHKPAMLQSAVLLISEGANLGVISSQSNETLLHLAAKARDLKFFKLLCVSGDKDWDVHAQDNSLRTPMHKLFAPGIDITPQNSKEITEVLQICRILVKMQRSDREPLVDVEDVYSLRPLALAVQNGFAEGVRLLIDLGADVHDEDHYQQTCFHFLAGVFNRIGGNGAKIAQVLLEKNANCASRSRGGTTPFISSLGTKTHNETRFSSKETMGKHCSMQLREYFLEIEKTNF
ncbi:hypothetical protein ABW21_db0200660 [Orbilia brochopaga]|nr:hypothetical protein ABW21_db0200660 [Drechslerella brochopaga]